MQTLSFQAPEEMAMLLEHFAEEMDRSKAYLIRQAIAEYLQDLQDYHDAKSYKAKYNPKENVSFDTIKKQYKLNKQH